MVPAFSLSDSLFKGDKFIPNKLKGTTGNRELSIPGVFEVACEPEKVFIKRCLKQLHQVVVVGTLLLVLNQVAHSKVLQRL